MMIGDEVLFNVWYILLGLNGEDNAFLSFISLGDNVSFSAFITPEKPEATLSLKTISNPLFIQ